MGGRVEQHSWDPVVFLTASAWILVDPHEQPLVELQANTSGFWSIFWGTKVANWNPEKLRSHPQGPLEDTPDTSPTVSGGISFFVGFGEVWDIFPDLRQ